MQKTYIIRSIEHIHREFFARLDNSEDLISQGYDAMANFFNFDGTEDLEIVEVVSEEDEDDYAEMDDADSLITIEVEGGMVTNVYNLPDGFDYEIVDHDLETGE
jgi:predicted ATPase